MENMRFNYDISIKNFEKVNEEFAKVKIYVLYTGKNRNKTILEKETVENMLYSLKNIPVVGEWIESNENFGGHGGKLEITDREIKYIETTKPYGVVPSDTEIAWEMVKEKDGLTEHEYLTCTAYLWYKRYPEIEKILNDGSNQSMEISVGNAVLNSDGYYEIKEATFSALCILGKDSDKTKNVEPCFEGSKIIAYSLDKNEFIKQFNEMIDELKFSLNQSSQKEVDIIENSNEGGNGVVDIVETNAEVVVETVVVEQITTEVVEEFTSTEEVEQPEVVNNKYHIEFELSHDDIRSKLYDLINPIDDDGNRDWNYWIAEVFQTYFIAQNWDDNSYFKFDYSINGDEISLNGEKVEVEMKWMIKGAEPSSETVFTKEQYEQLELEVNTLKSEVEGLREFKHTKEKENKLAVVAKFKNLTEEDIKPIIENLDNYNLEQLETHLFALIGKKVEFSNNENNVNHEKDEIKVLKFALTSKFDNKDSNTPAWAGLVEQYKNKSTNN